MSNNFIVRCCENIFCSPVKEFEQGFGKLDNWGYSEIIAREQAADKETNVFKRRPSFSEFNKIKNTDAEYVIYGRESSICDCFITLDMAKCEYSRFFVVAEKNTKFRLFIDSENVKDKEFVFIFSIEQGSDVEIVSLNDDCENVSTFIYVNQATESLFKSFTISYGVKNGCNYIKGLMNNPQTEAHFYGVSLVDAGEQVDNHAIMGHFADHCNSTQHYKSVVAPEGKSLFKGSVYVAKDAQKTKAFQQSNNILLGDGARARNLLQLEIYADDVKCSHGSTTGELDTEALFYMRQRGIPVEEAKKLQIRGFIGDIILKIDSEELIEKMINKITQKLANI